MMKLKIVGSPHYCSFCDKDAKEIGPLIMKENENHIKICINCAKMILKFVKAKAEASNYGSTSIIKAEYRLLTEKSESLKKEKKNTFFDFSFSLKPQDIKAEFDKYVIAQERAKKTTAIAIYNHFKRINHAQHKKNNDSVEIQKSNILFLGPTGSGKTLLAETIAKIRNVPFVIANACSITEAGYVGDDVEDMIRLLLVNANGDKEAAEKGIVYIDEIDKVAKTSNYGKDVGEQSVQEALLKIIEGTKVMVPNKHIKKNKADELFEIDTTNILFILGGAFNGLNDIIAKRTNKKTIGFGSKINSKVGSLLNNVENEDLIKFGFIPEFIGRLPIISTFDELTVKDLVKILVQPKNAIIKQYQESFTYDHVELIFTKNALLKIATEALKQKSGARGLRKIIDSSIEDIMFDIPSMDNVKECIVTEETIKTGEYKVRYHKEQTKIKYH